MDEPVYRPFLVEVVRTERLSPTFQRVTVAGACLANFAAEGYDQRINLVFPLPDRPLTEFPADADWYDTWRVTDPARRHPLRTYTIRASRPGRCELDIDFVLHGATGPASRWAGAARPGDPLIVIGPDARRVAAPTAITWAPPAGVPRLLLAGDETAVPALSAIVAALPPRVPATVLIEVPYADDVLEFPAADGAEVVWLPRARSGGAASAAPGELLVPAVREAVAGLRGCGDPARALPEEDAEADDLWEVPAPGGSAVDPCYAWFAGEAGVVRQLRRHLVTEVGMDRGSVAFMGYWRLGRAAPN